MKTKALNRNFILLIIGQALSMFGTVLLKFTVSLLILDLTSSAALFGIITAISYLPPVFLSLIAGIIADRNNKRNLMITLDGLYGIMAVLLVLSLSFSNILILITVIMKQLLKDEMLKEGYDIGEVEITVGTTYEAVGEALVAGTADVGLIPGGTYVLYDDGCDVILTATRDGLSKDFDDPKDWNDGTPTEASDKQAVSYRALLIAGPSEKGQALVAKVNAGEELTWDELNSANWSVMGSSSPAGYIYPALWLQDRYSKGITDLASAVQSDSYASAFARLASGQVDVLVTYADARRDYAERWNTEFGREGSIWEETGLIGVTAPIYNDTVSVSKTSSKMDADMIAALQNAFINIGNTPEGKEVIAIYSHNGYQKAQSSDYDNERAAQKLIQELTAAN